ncbi:citrate lyase subunit alpha [Isobaculum melis]|uniref:Citrate lyase alpha chain n=1 Tax=Isobaculum melis TaxID=142588 RepID=A0A1H9TMP9_9LACT|nr:citrate lyase subunit alpha [Isobaculum melis]SER97893.1 citrate lyase subunit alpha / citrate CoA-transferase [Isobaculum melis]
MQNKVGREIPDAYLNDYALYESTKIGNPTIQKVAPKISVVKPGDEKLVASIEEAIDLAGLKDGMTISFHHHFREGDYVLNMVMDVIAKKGIKNLSIAPSSLADVHSEIVKHIESGVVTKVTTSGLRGKLGEAISNGLMDEPVILRSHGGRARAVETGEIQIDVAFLGVPSSDAYGNANGYKGESVCGSLGYAKIDAKHADKVILLTDNLVGYPNTPISISQTDVDYVVEVEAIGNPEGIGKGATRFTTNPKELRIAETVNQVITASPYFKDGFSFQTGTGGAALAVTRFLREEMLAKEIKASFALGGITKPMVDLLEEGLVEKILDVQDFDKGAALGMAKYEQQVEIDASCYASPYNKGAVVNQLDVVILSALEVDTKFNVNVMTGSDGVLRGAIGGHQDASNAKLTIISAPLVRGRIPTIVQDVTTVITPGDSIDVVVTEIGIAINPQRQDLIDCFTQAGLPVYTIEALQKEAEKIVGKASPIQFTDRVVALVEYRDGTLLDTICQVKD